MAIEKNRDAAGMTPRLIPDYELLPRDDSGGPEWDAYTQQFGDSGFVVGNKAHLSVSGGKDDELDGDEQDEDHRRGSAKKIKESSDEAPAISKKRAKE